jgi:ribosomal protein L16 Arg81 hydroxylase
MALQLHPEYQERKTSAIALIKLLLENRKPEILSGHYRELLSTLLWKITEAESQKYKTRFQTQGAIECSDKGKLRHEHVYQRKQMIARLLNAKPEEVDGILEKAVGCTVTIDEHSRLAKWDDEYGWDRYRKAGLVVIDTATGERKI